MTEPKAANVPVVLRTSYDPGHRSISLELDVGERGVQGGSRLALTSIVQLTPPATATPSPLVRRLATYHEFAIGEDPVAADTTWSLVDLHVGHRPQHSNDGPVSAFVILPDDTTIPVAVEPMRRLGGAPVPVDPSFEPPADPPPDPPGDSRAPASNAPALVPFPVSVVVIDDTPSDQHNAHLADGPAPARQAWAAVSALEHRVTGGSRLRASSGLPISAVEDDSLAAEAYLIAVDPDAITVAASTIDGFRHAFVTLARWLPNGLPRRAHIQDQPRYPWRGLHIDLARQWFEPALVERLIDVAAWRKLSRLHLHLTDDEAWRLPVDPHPELGEVGGTRGHGRALPPMLGGGAAPSGRAYTPDEIARWVVRSDELGVTLVPEVDLPAHAHAALTAMPQLRDPLDGSRAESVQHFTNNLLVPGHPLLDDFLGDVVESVAKLFASSPWIHIGGDEVPDGAWDGSPMVAGYRDQHGLSTTSEVERAFHHGLVDKVRERTGRQVGAWQEAAESGGIRPGDGYVVGWRTPEASRTLAAAGYDVVVSPGQAYYLDMAVDDRWSTVGASWAGAVSLDDVCNFVPDEGWTDEERSRLLGIQACLWTEHVDSTETLDHLLFPRLDAIAERAWTGAIVGGPASLRRRAT